MANLTEAASFDLNVYRIDELDPVQGWNGTDLGVSNLQAQALANRTQWLKSKVDLGPRFSGFLNFTPASAGQNMLLNAGEVAGSLLRVNTSSFNGTVSLPVCSSCPDGANIAITNEPGSAYQYLSANVRTVAIGAQSGDLIVDIDNGVTAQDHIILPFTVMRIHRVATTLWVMWRESSAEYAPAGIVSAWTMTSPPNGWLECNGAAISRTSYSRLYANIGTRFGIGNGSTTFNIPDLRGEFIRGWDNGRGLDLNSLVLNATIANGSASVSGLSTTFLFAGMSVSGAGIPVGTTILSINSGSTLTLSANATATGPSVPLTFAGRMHSSLQADAFKSHFHVIKKNNYLRGTGANFFGMDDAGVDGSENTESVGDVETRPRNMALMYCIKY